MLLGTVFLFAGFSIVVFVVHEQQAEANRFPGDSFLRRISTPNLQLSGNSFPFHSLKELNERPHLSSADLRPVTSENTSKSEGSGTGKDNSPIDVKPFQEMWDDAEAEAEEQTLFLQPEDHDEHEKVGTLMCNGKDTKSEVIYWKIVPGDDEFESPITPHHDNHHDRYLTFEYDNGGWNNIRMSLECLIVSAHAMGRTVVLPPSQHLYLLTKKHKDKGEEKLNSEMGFEDFFDLDILKSHKGFHVITMKEFLEKEALQGGLHNKLPPGKSSDIWGPKLWHYLESVADEKPAWGGRFIAFPDRPGDFNFTDGHHPKVLERMKRFGGDRFSRKPIYYDEGLQKHHHIHFPGREHHRVLQHHYGRFDCTSPLKNI